MRARRLWCARGVIVLVCVATTAGSQTVISTTGGGAPLTPFGKPDAQTFGQTFTTPTANLLQNFTFYLSPAPSLTFRAYVFAWDAASVRATGSALFTSSPIIGPLGSGFNAITVNVGGLLLNSDAMYVAFFSSSGQGTLGEIALQSSWDSPATNQYSGGAFVFLNNGENSGAFTTQTWSTNRQGPGSDARFTMAFTSVAPEPSSLILSLTGVLSLGAVTVVRRRKSRGQAISWPLGTHADSD
jgi:hypothetical protein